MGGFGLPSLSVPPPGIFLEVPPEVTGTGVVAITYRSDTGRGSQGGRGPYPEKYGSDGRGGAMKGVPLTFDTVHRKECPVTPATPDHRVGR